MEEVGAQVAPAIFIHQALASRFCEPPSLPRKRDLSYQTPSFQYQNPSQQRLANPTDNWNPKLWEWDTVRFIAKPLDTQTLLPGTATAEQIKKDLVNGNENSIMSKKTTVVNVDDEGLQLNLAGGLNSVAEPVSRPNKKVRSGSPGSTNYPMCQVDNCKEDLSNAKDYHRRHKVCEIHSKATKALVGKQMQRFCQQCSRFHPLSEFDDGKRSCRRRLAGHNRRRRKTQPEDLTSRLLLPVNRDNAGNGNLDIVNLLTALARTQGKNEDKSINYSSVTNRDQLIQILSKINSLHLPMDLAAKLPNVGVLNRKNQDQPLVGQQNQLNEKKTSSPSTVDLLAALSATLTSSSSDAFAILSQRSSQNSDSEKTKSTCPDNVAAPRTRNRAPLEFTSVGGESSTSYQSPVEDSECQIQETRAHLPLQLFSSSPEDDSPPKLASSGKYFSSDSSNPMEERSPSSSPIVQKLFPMHSTAEAVKYEKMQIGRDTNINAEGSRTHVSILPLELFSGSKKETGHSSFQHFPSQAGYTSSGSDHSPSSLNSDAQDRTGRIIFKLFDKDPSHFPGTLRTQIYNWLSNSPSEMESYIRPGCVVLSLYVSMSSVAWEQLEGNLLQYVNCLLQDSDSDFWRKARFLVYTGRQFASHKDGKIRLCKSWRSWSSPELISVSPLAIVGGQESSLLVRGRNLTNPGTQIRCAYMGGYSSMQISGSAYQGSPYDEVNMVGGFKIHASSTSALGRCFIEVENGFKGNSFPIIIADATICKELRLLESEFDIEAKASSIISEEHAYDSRHPRSMEEVLHFLNELGWLFQRRSTCPLPKSSDYSLCRFKFLLIFSVERDYCALVKVLLDILVESNLDMDGLSRESLAMLSEIQLLCRAVKRRCRKMADLLIHYSVSSSDGNSKKYIFPPNLEGAGGITPLHLAACTSSSEHMVDALTNDPQEIGLSCWNSLLDANGQSPYTYAMMRNNHTYNKLVAGKFADRRNGQVSVRIGIEDELLGLTAVNLHEIGSQFKQGRSSCAKCAVVAAKFNKRFPSSQGLLQRPYVHSMLAIAAVCVCVCLFLRGLPDIGSVAPFKWENLDFGTI
ncbi:squamosa promoter-binding-like protein 14 [Durio zibethinus]|uniref:Squamosa promoter-binding-like protein 14 n=1 Tax=Durio zibethinus TaxID=66656 RepID=A0A6P6AX71_DURZI|nr:squamosa promoter-binding-like protein 14 [Durio zibethinus]XP_022769463.1 squamosa promoter-binding-like protein 14 [Durio zibethinus]